MNATYRYIRGEGLLRGLNLSAPVNGVRPSPEFGNVVQVAGDGQMRQHVWNFGGQTNFPQELGRTARRFDFRRFNTNRTNLMNYSGVLTSPFYGKPTMAQGARRIHVNMNLQF